MYYSLLLPIAAVLAGAVVPFQGGANAALGRALGHPLWATMMSLGVSALCLIPALVLLKVPMPVFSTLSAQPKWIWIGGVAGVIYITAAILLVPRLGAAGFMTAVIAGQILASVAIDTFGGVGLPARPMESVRLVGVLLVTLGAIAVQWPALFRASGS
ncbi:DMT family transporter [Roseibium suaedae]|uniref:Transporter family-2 protein n=1 Tax=Roseibium suaedae TaxID=735517 RepID=A0A1M7CI22_9HYPH|nr:DMT family transporter [Roseibium suaedae]SHL66797.1 transporter family-2 protein [Roseibium suaedae]